VAQYIAPGAHLIYADADGHIAYWTLCRIPIRKNNNTRLPHEGWTGEDEWLGYIPPELMPQVLDPQANFISTANNLPIGSWYPYPIAGVGENGRSWRLREILAGRNKFSPQDFLALVHRDCTNPIVRDFVTLALKVIDEDGPPSAAVARCAEVLRGWDFRMTTDSPAYPLAEAILRTIHRSLRGTPTRHLLAPPASPPES